MILSPPLIRIEGKKPIDKKKKKESFKCFWGPILIPILYTRIHTHTPTHACVAADWNSG